MNRLSVCKQHHQAELLHHFQRILYRLLALCHPQVDSLHYFKQLSSTILIGNSLLLFLGAWSTLRQPYIVFAPHVRHFFSKNCLFCSVLITHAWTERFTLQYLMRFLCDTVCTSSINCHSLLVSFAQSCTNLPSSCQCDSAGESPTEELDYHESHENSDGYTINVTLKKDAQAGLGLTLVDGNLNGVKGVYVKSVTEGGAGKRGVRLPFWLICFSHLTVSIVRSAV